MLVKGIDNYRLFNLGVKVVYLNNVDSVEKDINNFVCNGLLQVVNVIQVRTV